MSIEARVSSVTIRVCVARGNKLRAYGVLLEPEDPFMPIGRCLRFKRREVELIGRIESDNLDGFRAMVDEMIKVERLASGLLLGKFVIVT